jgi:hypothetical protein
MQTALQLADNAHAQSAPSPRPSPIGRGSKKRSVRTETMRAIHVTWKKVAFGIDVSDKDELRVGRLRFCEKTLGLRRTLKSMGSLSGAQLGRVLDEMRRLERAPALPGVVGAGLVPARARAGTSPAPTDEAEIYHLATTAQVEAIDKLFAYLNWTPAGIERFIDSKFHRTSARMLTPAQANALTMIIFNIAASRDIRARGAQHACRLAIRQEIPRLKRALGIDQKPSADFTEEEFDG